MSDTAWQRWDDPLTEGLFRGRNPEEVRHNKLKHYENALMRQVTGFLSGVRKPEARRFLQHGFLLRHMMMQRSRIELRDRTIARTEPLDPYVATHLATHLNAYYLNLVGALDNLAWAAAFELHLQDSLSEADWESRKFCTIASKQFRRALTGARPSLGDTLSEAASWLTELKEFRDPAAHRLPLAVVAALLGPDDQAEFERLTKSAREAAEAGDLDRWSDFIWQREQLGKFAPILGAPRATDGRLILVPNQVAADQEHFLRFASRFLEESFEA